MRFGFNISIAKLPGKGRSNDIRRADEWLRLYRSLQK